MSKLAWYILLFVVMLPVRAEDSVLLAAMGDVMLSRSVPKRLTAHGAAWAWAVIKPVLAPADIRFCNLECPVSRCGVQIPKRFSFRADPIQAQQVLKAGGIDVVSLANNHTYDYQRDALAETMAVVRKAHIVAPGAGVGRAGAIAPRYIISHGLKIAFVAYTYWVPEGYLPADNGADVATLDESTLAAELRAAKRGADLLVVSIHWGVEYSAFPSDSQRRIGHAAIDAGADVVLGHHPHVAQPVEIYHQRPICYSLGNCIFDRSGTRWSNGKLVLIRLSRHCVALEREMALQIKDARPIVDIPVAATK